MPAPRDPKFDNQVWAYEQGESLSSIAERLGTSVTVVSRAFRRRGVILRDQWLVTEEDRAVIIAMYETGDYKMQELADAFGYKSYVSISEILTKGRNRKKRPIKTKRRGNRRAPMPVVKICGYRECNKEVRHKYCKDLHMRLERSAKAKDKREAEDALIIY